MLWTIWLEVFMRQVLAIRLGVFCRAGIINMPAMRKKTTKKTISKMAKEISEPKTMTMSGRAMEREMTPDGVQLRWQISNDFCKFSAVLPSTFILRIDSALLQACS